MLTAVIIILAAVGLWITTYFTGVYYRWFSPHVFWVPRLCQLDKKSCLSVLETPRAKIFGLPNSVFGMVIYGYLLFFSWLFSPLWGFLLLIPAMGRSLYLAYSLVFVTRIPCTLCFTSHAINLVLLIIHGILVFG